MCLHLTDEDIQRINDEMAAGLPPRRPISPLTRKVMSNITTQDIERNLSEAARSVRTGYAAL